MCKKLICIFLSVLLYSCSENLCNCDELYKNTDSLYVISENGHPEVREKIALHYRLKNHAVFLKTKQQSLEKERKRKAESSPLSEKEIKEVLELEFTLERNMIDILKTEMKVKETELWLQREEISTLGISDMRSFSVYTGRCKSYSDKKKTKLKTEAEFEEGKLKGKAKHYSENGDVTESENL